MARPFDGDEQEVAEGYIGGAPMPPMILYLMLGGAVVIPLLVGWFHGRQAMAVFNMESEQRGFMEVIGASVDVGVLLGAMAISIGLFAWALMIFLRNRRVMIGLVTDRWVLAMRNDTLQWKEPIEAYRAVAMIREPSGVEGVDYIRLELRHPNQKKNVSLGNASSEAAGLSRLDDLAAALKLKKIIPEPKKAKRS